MMAGLDENHSIARQIHDGFDRIAMVMRSDAWSAVSAKGLNPAQASVLLLLAARRSGMRSSEIADHLLVSGASVADTVGALARKLLVRKTRDVTDARAATVLLTDAGRQVAAELGSKSGALGRAIDKLDGNDQARLLHLQVCLIRNLQEAGAIPLQRMCITCSHFHPHVHNDGAKPHHCSFMDAPFGPQQVRLECGDHDPADPETQSANWISFNQALPNLQART